MKLERGQIWNVCFKGDERRWVIVSQEEFNRGSYVTVAPITSTKFEQRSKLPNCVPLSRKTPGISCDCVIQGEGTTLVEKERFLADAQLVGKLSGESRMELVKAIGYVIGGDCTPLD